MNDANANFLHVGSPIADSKVVCIFIHGRGQSPEAMHDHVIARLSAANVAYLLPRAPTGSWYQAKAVDPLTALTRQQLVEALSHIEGLVKAVPKSKPVLLSGFSQGACVALEFAMKHGAWNGAMANFTGCRVGVPNDDRPSASLLNLPVYLTGSNADPWIPIPAWAQAAEALNGSGARLRAESFPGRAHEVSAAEVQVLDGMLQALALGQKIWSAPL